MTEAFRTYLIQIIATAVICSVIKLLSEKTVFRKPMQLILAAAMLLAALQPLTKWRLDDIPLPINGIMQQCEDIVHDGVTSAETAAAAIIMQQTRTYIVEKASQLGAQLTVEVDIKDSVPQGVTITGNTSPYIQLQLATWLESELGIPREAQQWN